MSRDGPPPFAAEQPEAGPLLVVISGPSGVGKDAVLSRLQERGISAHYTVTATTRPKRETADAPFPNSPRSRLTGPRVQMDET